MNKDYHDNIRNHTCITIHLLISRSRKYIDQKRRKTYIKRDERLLLMSTGFHVDGNKLIVKLFLMNRRHDTEGGGGERTSMNLDSHFC